MEPYSPRINFTADGWINHSAIELVDSPRYLTYEFEIIDWKSWVTYSNSHRSIVFFVGLVYIPLIFGIQHFMKNRKPFILKKELFLWNAALGLFSIVGFIRFAPEFVEKFLQPNGLYTSMCICEGASNPIAFWGIAFVLSKYVELGDTIFIVLRKKPLVFLQWYHHVVTMTVTWLTMPYTEPISRFYVAMNYGVHSFMYPYFALKALDIRVPRLLAHLITTLQLGQMLIGLFVNSYSAFLFYSGSTCYRHPSSLKLFFLVYGSFVVLFGKLFYELVVQKNHKNKLH